jgi:hypothetical protein
MVRKDTEGEALAANGASFASQEKPPQTRGGFSALVREE